MAVGGMVGGGIFATLGVVIGIAGRFAWLSFVIAGVVALLSGYGYAHLARRHGEGGGAFTFLREVRHEGLAGSLAWVLILGYVLTNAVYAATFGAYLSHVLPVGVWGSRLAAVAMLLVFLGVNLRGAGEAGGIEVLLVWFKLVVLLGLAAMGLRHWDPALLAPASSVGGGPGSAFLGAAAIFMAYEGFQLLTYDYEDLRDPERTLPWAIAWGIGTVVVVYVAVSLGTPMLIGAGAVRESGEVALLLAGRQAWGGVGVGIVLVAVAFSTGSAVNATLFATARLARHVAAAGDLPAAIGRRNRAGVPDRALVTLACLSAVFAMVGSLADLVEAGSLAFLLTFAVVSGLAVAERAGSRVVNGLGLAGSLAAAAVLSVRIYRTSPVSLAAVGGVVFLAAVVRPLVASVSRSD
jgi:amino acid transporter